MILLHFSPIVGCCEKTPNDEQLDFTNFYRTIAKVKLVPTPPRHCLTVGRQWHKGANIREGRKAKERCTQECYNRSSASKAC